MRKIIIIFSCVFFISTVSCRKSYTQQDLKFFTGNWKIQKVTVEGTTLENYGEMSIDENGIGKMKLNYYPYDPSTPPIEGIFNLVTSTGHDLFIRLYGAYWLNPDGTPGHMLCDQESELSVRVPEIRKKSMQWDFAETTSIYDCDIRQNSYGNMTNVSWYLVRK